MKMIPKKKLVESIERYFEENPPNLGDTKSILDVLFWLYMEYNPADSETIKSLYAQLRKCADLPLRDYDQEFYIVSDLCVEHGKEAFREGLGLGIQLMQEVNNS